MTRVHQRAVVRPHSAGQSFYVASGGQIGSASMTSLVVLFRNPRVTVAGQEEICGNFSAGGWLLLKSGAVPGTLLYLVVDGGGASRIPAPTFTVPTAPEALNGRALICAMGHDGATVRWNLNNAVTGSVACVGYDVAASNFGILAREVGTSQTRIFDVAAVLHTDAAAADAAGLASIVAQATDDLAQGRDFTLPSAEHYWDARDIVTPGAPLVTWPDRIGALDLSRGTRVVQCASVAGRPA